HWTNSLWWSADLSREHTGGQALDEVPEQDVGRRACQPPVHRRADPGRIGVGPPARLGRGANRLVAVDAAAAQLDLDAPALRLRRADAALVRSPRHQSILRMPQKKAIPAASSSHAAASTA